MGAGKRRQIRIEINRQIKEYIAKYSPYGYTDKDMNDLAGSIMRLFPKPEVTTFFIKETAHFRIRYYQCGKCKGCMGESPMACGMHFCPYCGRRILAMEDKTLCQ